VNEFVQRRATTAKSKYAVSDFAGIKKSFLTSLIETVVMEDIPAELILNWDQTGIMIVPSNSLIMIKWEQKSRNCWSKRQMANYSCVLWYHPRGLFTCTINI